MSHEELGRNPMEIEAKSIALGDSKGLPGFWTLIESAANSKEAQREVVAGLNTMLDWYTKKHRRTDIIDRLVGREPAPVVTSKHPYAKDLQDLFHEIDDYVHESKLSWRDAMTFVTQIQLFLNQKIRSKSQKN